jgi:hypothetical protein
MILKKYQEDSNKKHEDPFKRNEFKLDNYNPFSIKTPLDNFTSDKLDPS